MYVCVYIYIGNLFDLRERVSRFVFVQMSPTSLQKRPMYMYVCVYIYILVISLT